MRELRLCFELLCGPPPHGHLHHILGKETVRNWKLEFFCAKVFKAAMCGDGGPNFFGWSVKFTQQNGSFGEETSNCHFELLSRLLQCLKRSHFESFLSSSLTAIVNNFVIFSWIFPRLRIVDNAKVSFPSSIVPFFCVEILRQESMVSFGVEVIIWEHFNYQLSRSIMPWEKPLSDNILSKSQTT